MKTTYILIVITLIFFIIPLQNISQAMHVIIASGHTFTPSDLTISAGDTVRWENQGGLHNVMADDGSFTSGAASSSSWTYDKVFTSVGNFRYYCEIHGSAGGIGMSGIIRVINPTTNISENTSIANHFSLEQNFPNPFNPVTTIRYSIPQNGHVQAKVFTILGKELAVLVDREQSAGYHEIQFDAAKLPSGVYFYTVQEGSLIRTKRMLLLK